MHSPALYLRMWQSCSQTFLRAGLGPQKNASPWMPPSLLQWSGLMMQTSLIFSFAYLSNSQQTAAEWGQKKIEVAFIVDMLLMLLQEFAVRAAGAAQELDNNDC